MRDEWSHDAEGGTEGDPPTDEMLALQALLYASGELEEAEAVAFEERLADDQAARDALCQAVQLTETLAGNPEVRPNPAYRARVRRRLRQRRRLRETLAGTLRLTTNPFLWTLIGLTLAIVLIVAVVHMIAVMHAPATQPGPTAPSPTLSKPGATISYGPASGAT
jgi:anti-sigma-K factor RskA